MWYFSWILGVGLAMAFGIINVMWLEAEYFQQVDTHHPIGEKQ
jgi:cytochrome bd-I ubiquinol oxidase subunit X